MPIPEFPSTPLTPSQFMGSFLPAVLAEFNVPDNLYELDEMVGVHLTGKGGGEWRVTLKEGEIAVATGSREEATVTLVQDVEDWRGALWEGRGGPVGRYAARLFTPRTAEIVESIGGRAGAARAALGPLRDLDALFAVVIAEDEAGDWTLQLKLGPGPIPTEPDTTITLCVADAEAMLAGELGALEAFMAGRIQVDGDVGLMMQVQGILMQAARGDPANSP